MGDLAINGHRLGIDADRAIDGDGVTGPTMFALDRRISSKFSGPGHDLDRFMSGDIAEGIEGGR